jgi:hypothetical protein
MPKIDMRDNISYIYELRELRLCAYGAVENYCNCQMKALKPLFETFILFGLLEEALPAQYALALFPLMAKCCQDMAK